MALEEASLEVSGLVATVVGKFGNFSIIGNVDVVSESNDYGDNNNQQ